jgi:hypothetical protein
VSPEQGQRPTWLEGGHAHAGMHGAATSARAWHLGYLILAAGRGSHPAQAVTAGRLARMASVPAVAAGPRCPRLSPLNKSRWLAA